MKKICLAILLLVSIGLNAQTSKVGYVIEIEGSNVFLDFTSKDVKMGDRLKVISDRKTMIHPVTKEEIIKEGELVATLEVTETHNNYSVSARVYPANALSKLTVGAKVYLPTDSSVKVSEFPKDGKVNVAIAAATINDLVGPGYFGNYVSDMLIGELLDCDKIRVIDRSLLSAQVSESNLKETGYINADNAIMKGQISGVQYMIQVTMQKPDVTNLTTGTPVKSILNAASAVSQIAGAPGLSKSLEIGVNLSSNVVTSTLRSKVSISARVVDVQTGEVLFMCNGAGTAQGEMQAELEGGALGGMQINGGVDGFKQTITGKAISIAYRNIGMGLRDFFNGKTSEKVVNAGIISELSFRKGRIYQGVNKISRYEIKELYNGTPNLYFNYVKGINQNAFGTTFERVGEAGFALFFIDLVLGHKEGNRDDHFGISHIQYKNTNTVILCALGSTVIGLSGYLLKKQGVKKINNGINRYNQSLKRSMLNPDLRFGFGGNGLSLTMTF